MILAKLNDKYNVKYKKLFQLASQLKAGKGKNLGPCSQHLIFCEPNKLEISSCQQVFYYTTLTRNTLAYCYEKVL